MENCDEHYRGELAILEEFLIKLQSGATLEELEKIIHEKREIIDPHSHGEHDGDKAIKTAIDYLKEEQISRAEVEQSIKEKIDRLKKITG